jgi:hypothetical protein
MEVQMKFDKICKVGGDGIWSLGKEKMVTLTELELVNSEIKCGGGELRVYFDKNTWDVNVDGLIYTDVTFQAELTKLLNDHGFSLKAGLDICYSECGMQGDDYVSFDAGISFGKEFRRKKVEGV